MNNFITKDRTGAYQPWKLTSLEGGAGAKDPAQTEAQAQQCPSRYEPVIVEDEAMDLYDVIEEELLLALPVAPKHDHACVELPGQSQAEIEAEDRKPNPFEVLARLTDDSSES